MLWQYARFQTGHFLFVFGLFLSNPVLYFTGRLRKVQSIQKVKKCSGSSGWGQTNMHTDRYIDI